MAHTIVIIEDDMQVCTIVSRYLVREGFHTLLATTGQEGLTHIRNTAPALILLDVNLPDIDGWSILRRIRSEADQQPAVIMLTARSDEPDRLLGLDLGADDYIVKPFSVREVAARVKAVLRRTQAGKDETMTLEFPGLCIDIAGRTVMRQQQRIELTPKEFDLLTLLATHPNRVLTRVFLYDHIWGDEGQGDDHTLDVHLNRLRRKLLGTDQTNYIRTIKGVGVKFEVMREEI